MLRLCYRQTFNIAKARVASAASEVSTRGTTLHVNNRTARNFSSLSTSEHPEVTDKCGFPELVQQEWLAVEDWDYQWFDGRDKLHIRVKATEDNTQFRGVGFYSKEGYWMGTIRWNERLRGEEPAVWIHWVGKDPVQLATSLPHPDDNGCYTFTIAFHKREVSVHCNGHFIGERKNMIYQFRNVARVWFADLECVKGSYAIEGPHTDDSGYTVYTDVPMFRQAKDMWKLFRKAQKEHSELQYPDHGWRSS